MIMANNNPYIYTHTYRLSAAQCNAQRELAPASLVQQIIEVSTEHADMLGIGFERLKEDGNLWVLSRIAIEMKRYPRLFEHYSLSTWIEGYCRNFSERNFEILGEGDEVIGYARTVWFSINMNTRRPADLSGIADIARTVSDHPCPIARQGKIHPITTPQTVHEYTFVVSDIDVNRHVNSARYVELILNQFTLDSFDEYYLSRFEIEYKRECHFGKSVEVCSTFTDDTATTAIMHQERPVCLARSLLTPRDTPFTNSENQSLHNQ